MSNTRRVLVTGGRDYGDVEQVDGALEIERLLAVKTGVELVVIQGGARGADALAREWCARKDVMCVTVPAHWENGRSAGPKRNRRMLLLNPGLVIAAPGGFGTENMKQAAFHAGVPVSHLPSEIIDND